MFLVADGLVSPNNSPPNKLTTPAISRLPSTQPRTVERRPVVQPLSTEGSIIPGETEEDGELRREYVLVGDTRAVEIDRAVDGKEYLHKTSKAYANISQLSRNQRRALSSINGPQNTTITSIRYRIPK